MKAIMRRQTILRFALGLALASLGMPAVAQVPAVSLTLDDAVRRFLDQNLEVEAARLQVDRARAGQIAAGLRPNPRVDVIAENFRLAGDTPFSQLYEVAVSYGETIELGGKRRLRGAVADLEVRVAEVRLEEALRRGVSEVKRLYYEALLARENRAIAVQTRDAFEQLVEYNQVRFEGGAAPEGELIKVRLEHTKLDAAVRRADLALEQARIRLVERIGESNYSAYTVAGELSFDPSPLDLGLLQATAAASRPDLRAARLEVDLASERFALERARGVPNITPFVGYKRAASNHTILFGVSIPLGTRNRNQGGIARAVADENIAEATLGAIRNRILAEVESAYRSYETARMQLLTFQQQLLLPAAESHQIALVTYQEGATELLPVLEAQRTEIDVRQEFLRTLFAYHTSIVELELAIGEDL